MVQPPPQSVHIRRETIKSPSKHAYMHRNHAACMDTIGRPIAIFIDEMYLTARAVSMAQSEGARSRSRERRTGSVPIPPDILARLPSTHDYPARPSRRTAPPWQSHRNPRYVTPPWFAPENCYRCCYGCQGKNFALDANHGFVYCLKCKRFSYPCLL